MDEKEFRMKPLNYFGRGFDKDTDKEKAKVWEQQRNVRECDDSELWNLDITIARFILPRLKRFKKIKQGHPATLTEQQWDKCLQKMIVAFALVLAKMDFNRKPQEKEQVKEGLELFAKYLEGLWD